MLPLPVETVVWAGFIVVLAYVVYGLTGFGASLVAVPLLAHFFALRFAVPMMVIFDLTAGVTLGLHNRGAIDKKELRRIIPFMLIGVVLGATVLVNVPDRWLLFVLGAFLISYPAWSLLFPPGAGIIAPGWVIPLGTIGGIFAATFGTGGPVFAVYLARRLQQKSALRATLSSMVTLAGLSRLAVFVTAGLYLQHGLLLLAMMLLPCVLVGLAIGSRLHQALPAGNVVKAIWLLLILAGASLLRRAIGEF